jgi:tetratricopeptide (TPR) repeat protein
LRRSEQTNVASLSFSKAGDISRRLEANTFIHGTIKSAGGMVRINAHLIESETEEIYKTFQIDGRGEEDIFIVIDSLAHLVRDYLEIRVLGKDMVKGIGGMITTQSPEAFRYYIQGFEIFSIPDWESSIEFFDRALEIDSLFSLATLYKAWAYHNIGQFGNLEMLDRSKENLQQLLTRMDELPFAMQQTVMYLKSIFDKDPFAGIRAVKIILEDDPQSFLWWQQGLNYQRLGQDTKALECYERMLDLIRQWGAVEGWPFSYTYPGEIYHRLGDHTHENENYEYGLSLNPDNRLIVSKQAVCALSQGDEANSAELLTKYRYILESEGADKSTIDFSIGQVYRNAGKYEKALGIFRKLLMEDPGNSRATFEIASILIRQEMDLQEGIRLVDGMLNDDPRDWDVLFLKGQGLYKLGRIGEAHRILSEAWDLRPFYHHEHYQLLDELERSVSRQE